MLSAFNVGSSSFYELETFTISGILLISCCLQDLPNLNILKFGSSAFYKIKELDITGFTLVFCIIQRFPQINNFPD